MASLWFLVLRLGFCVYLMLIIVLTGLLMNFLGLILFVTIRPFSVQMYRKLAVPLIYTFYSQLVAFCEWMSDVRVRIFLPPNSHNFSEHTIVIVNHTFEIDWVLSMIVMDKFHGLGYSKGIVKDSLKYFPAIGWTFFFSECIFVKRNAIRDKQIIQDGFDVLLDHPYPTFTVLFPEGTRVTPEKLQSSIEYAKSDNFEPFRYHLVPRTRGLEYILKRNSQRRNLHKTTCTFANAQIAFRKESSFPTVLNVLLGVPIKCDIYLEGIDIEDWKEDTIREEIFNVYRKKDDLMDYHKERDCFPGIEEFEKSRRRLFPIFNLFLWTGIMTFILMYTGAFFTNWIGLLGVTTLLSMTLMALFIMLRHASKSRKVVINW